MENLISILLRLLAVTGALSLAGCYKLDFENGQLRCSVPDKKCPSGFHCAVDGYCWKNGQDPTADMGNVGPDMAQVPPTPDKGGVVLSGGVTAKSANFKIIMSTGQAPGGNVDTSSSSYKLKSGLPALSR